MRCLPFALKKVWKEGGYLGLRKSRLLKIPFPHFLHFPVECKTCVRKLPFSIKSLRGGFYIGIGAKSFIPYLVIFPEECKYCDLVCSFVPKEKKFRICFPLWFDGVVQRGDE